MTSPPSSFGSFAPFSRLPTELRLNIWALNLPGPRTVDIYYTSPTASPSSHNHPRHLYGCASPARIPPNLHACHESRNAALGHYTLSFNLMHRPPQIFFDPQIDVLYFGNREGYLEGFKHFVNTLMIVDPAELGKVERLAVCAEIFSGGEYGRKGAMGGSVTTTSLKDFWEAVRSRFQGVKEVIVVPGIEGRGFPGLGNDDRLEKEGMDDRRDKKENLDAFYWRIVRAVSHVEERWGWVAPVWRVVALPEGERERM